MKLSVCTQALYHLPFEEALATAAALGFAAVELPVDAGSPFVDLEAALRDGGRAIQAALDRHGLRLSALSNHQEGTLLLGPHGPDTDGIFKGDAEAKIAWSRRRLIQTAELASQLGVDTVIGFIGCDRWSRFFPWPAKGAWDPMVAEAAARLTPILDRFQALGVRFGHECHPGQLAYDLETARELLAALGDHPAFGFNLDPANLLIVGADPVVFAAEMGARIWHVHAKDGERVRHNVASSLLAHGPWDRRDRGFRFRVPGWGQVPWRALITELHIIGFKGFLAVEHEDPTMSRMEGLRQAHRYLSPLMLSEPLEDRWW